MGDVMSSKPWGTEWSDALSMSDPQIDAEHRQLIDLIRQLGDAVGKLEQGRQDVLDTLEALIKRTTAHFEHEERVLREHAYPAGGEHAQIHAALIGELDRAMQTLQDSDRVQQWVEVAQGVDTLMRDHLEKEDSKYIAYLNNGR